MHYVPHACEEWRLTCVFVVVVVVVFVVIVVVVVVVVVVVFVVVVVVGGLFEKTFFHLHVKNCFCGQPKKRWKIIVIRG